MLQLFHHDHYTADYIGYISSSFPSVLSSISLSEISNAKTEVIKIDWFDTDEGDTGLDSTVLVFDDNITDCDVNDDQEMIEELD